jgi:DNA-binding sugar fermentation-stimulating protein
MIYETLLLAGTLEGVKDETTLFARLTTTKKMIEVFAPLLPQLCAAFPTFRKIYVSVHRQASNKDPLYVLEQIQAQGTLIAVNESRLAAVFEEALQKGKLKHLSDYPSYKKETSSVDECPLLRFYDEDHSCLVMAAAGFSKQEDSFFYPDDRRLQAQIQLTNLISVKKENEKAFLFIIFFRNDADKMFLSWRQNPSFAYLMTQACKKDVKIIAMRCKITQNIIEITDEVSIYDK